MRARLAVLVGLLVMAGCSSSQTPRAAAPTTTSSEATTTTSVATASTAATASVGSSTSTTAAAPATVRPATTHAPVSAATAALVCPPVPARNQPRSDRSRYTLSVTIDPAASRATGTMSVRFTPDLATDRIVLRLWPNSPNLAAAGAHLDPGRITVDGSTVATNQPDATTVVVRTAVAAGQTVVVTSEWTLAIARATSGRVTKVGDAIRLGSFFPLLPWEPGVGWALDPPTTVNGEASTAAAADFDLTVNVPAGNDVVAAGTEDRPGHWVATAVNDLAIATGHFRRATATAHAPDEVKITVVSDAGVKEEPGPYAAKIAKVIEQYGRRFGPFPFPS